MKRINIQLIILSMLMVISSCSKQGLETIPLEKSFEDPQIALDRYVQALTSAPSGWEFTLASEKAGYFAGFMDFQASGNGQFIVATDGSENAVTAPIQFETTVSNTNPTVSFLEGGYLDFAESHQQVDLRFTFQAARLDTIYLRGDQYGNQLKLVKAKPSQAAAYQEGRIEAVKSSVQNLESLPYYFKRLEINGAAYDLHFRADLNYLYIHYGGTERFRIHETPFSLTATGITLQHALHDGINTIDYIDDFYVDPEGTDMRASVGGIPVAFSNQPAPTAYDFNAAIRFFNSPPNQTTDGAGNIQRYSVSWDAFTVSGRRDVLEFTNTANFRFLVFFHQWVGQEYGLIQIAVDVGNGNQLHNYGIALRPLFTSPPAFIGFQYYGTLGEIPSPMRPKFETLKELLTNEYGYMVIKSGSSSYDLVSRDGSQAQNWIRFE